MVAPPVDLRWRTEETVVDRSELKGGGPHGHEIPRCGGGGCYHVYRCWGCWLWVPAWAGVGAAPLGPGPHHVVAPDPAGGRELAMAWRCPMNQFSSCLMSWKCVIDPRSFSRPLNSVISSLSWNKFVCTKICWAPYNYRIALSACGFDCRLFLHAIWELDQRTISQMPKWVHVGWRIRMDTPSGIKDSIPAWIKYSAQIFTHYMLFVDDCVCCCFSYFTSRFGIYTLWQLSYLGSVCKDECCEVCLQGGTYTYDFCS
jgi:hypothetical protein